MNENPLWFGVTSVYAVAFTLILCQWGEPIGRRLGLLDHPSALKTHRGSIPLLGGLSLVGVIVPLLPIFIIIFEPEGIGNLALGVSVLATVSMACIGISDDRKPLPALPRLGMMLVLFATVMAADQRFIIDQVRITGWGRALDLPDPVAFLFTLLIYVGFVNSVNMADGKNGLVIGLSMIWLLFLLTVGPPGEIIIVLPMVLMLAVLGVFNLEGRLFLGDGGTYGLSTLIATMSIYAYNIADGRVMSDTLALLFIVPGLDMVRLFFTRIMAGRSPLSGDRRHLHHYLLDRFGWPAGLIVYLGLVAGLIGIGILFRPKVPYIFVAGVVIYFAIVVWLGRGQRGRAAPDEDEGQATLSSPAQ